MKLNTKESLRHNFASYLDMKSTSSLIKDRRRHDDYLEKGDYSSWLDLKLTIYAYNNDKYLRELLMLDRRLQCISP
jgi:hypothetical protein